MDDERESSKYDEKEDSRLFENEGEKKEKKDKRQYRDHQMKNQVYLKREINFTIESPNNEQMPIRYKPEMTVETLLNLACKKFHLSAHDHYIVFNNKELDKQDTMKEFNINQNTVFKIYSGNKISSTPDIFVSIKVRDCRIGSVFKMTDDVWFILNDLLSASSFEPELVPIVIYRKAEMIGEEMLRQVRMRDLGVTSGSCVLRFIQLKQEDLDSRKLNEDEDAYLTLESLEMRAAGPLTDAGLRSVHFKLDEDEIDGGDIQFIGERKLIAFRLAEVDSPEEIVQEDYFDLLVEEIATLFNEVAKKHNARKEDVVNEVRAELENLKTIRTDFDDVFVRVQFPDRSCLQCLFTPEERIEDVKDYIRRFLRDQREDFDLCYGPNMTIPNDKSTLIELKMVPVVRFFYVPTETRNSSLEQYLADEIALNSVTHQVARDVGFMMRGESLERFLAADSDRDGRHSSRKSTGFLSKFLRSSHSSGKMSTSRNFEGPRSRSVWSSKKQSSFQPRSWSRGSYTSGRRSDDDDEEDEIHPRTSVHRSFSKR